MNHVISVIVPVYNAEQWLERCIDSVLVQTYTDLELILVDDGSTDSSATIIDKYARMDVRVRPIHQKNGGVSTARNVGLAAAVGEYIVFIDADDELYTPDTLERNVQFLIDDPETDIVTMPQYRESEEINPSSRKLLTKPLQFEAKVIMDKREMFLNWYTGRIIDSVYHGKVYRRNLFDGWHFTEDLIFTEDTYHIPDFCERVRKIKVSGVGGYVYKFNECSAIHTRFTPKKRRDQFKTQIRLCRYIRNFSEVEREESHLYISALVNAYYLWGTEYYDEALEDLKHLSKERRGAGIKCPTSAFQRTLNMITTILGFRLGIDAQRVFSNFLLKCRSVK